MEDDNHREEENDTTQHDGREGELGGQSSTRFPATMAFPVPTHLPRRPEPQDVTSKILSRMDEATNKTLNAALAKSWLHELDETIQDTKQRIHDRIHSDYPQFEEQLETSITIQERLKTLKQNLDDIGNSISNPETGLVPTLMGALKKHSALASEEAKARIRHNCLEHLSKCYAEYRLLVSLSEAGDLPEAIRRCELISHLVHDAPSPLGESLVMADFKRKFNATRARSEELLSDAFCQSVTVSAQELSVKDTVQVRQSEMALSLRDILSSLSTDALSNHLSTLRRDLTVNYIEGLLKQPMSLSSNSHGHIHKITCYPSPPNEEVLSSRLTNLSQTLEFLSTHLFSRLPESQQKAFPRSLCKSITSNVLNTLLIPSLPNAFLDLPSYLILTKEAVAFEKKYNVDLLGNDPHDKQVKHWVGGVGGHYERRRRTSILDEARKAALEPEDFSEVFTVEVDLPLEAESPAVIPVQPQVEESQSKSDDDAWGFDSSDSQDDRADADGWGFDDDVEDGTDATSSTEVDHGEHAINGDDAEKEPDPGDAWGWNEEEEPTPDSGEATDESAWDDPWGDSSTSSEPVDVRPPPAPSIKAAKTATRLEKLVNKGKKAVSATSTSSSSPEMLNPSTNNSPRLPPAPSVSSPLPPIQERSDLRNSPWQYRKRLMSFRPGCVKF
ncbi:ribosome biogenesis protein ytm1 [Marasmius tenuissimus]|nr:ribosome biogenesis protein ytm1 [Marasmius tenuissimus]